MKFFFERIDILVSEWVLRNFSYIHLRKFIVLLNRGEVFAILIIGLSLVDQVVYPILGFVITGIFAYINDRLILMIKKKVHRRRPSLRLLGKQNNHPDLNHSFPSAHAANSMLVAVILCNEFGFHWVLYLFSVLAGLGRLLTLHHFLSDVLGGWGIGLSMGIAGVLLTRYIKEILI